MQSFPSIDHQILKELLARRIADRQLISIIHRIIDSGASIHDSRLTQTLYPGDDLWALLRPRGLPIGNLTSQFWANVYLHELDQFVKQELRCPAYLRYMDDIVLFSDDKRQLQAWKSQIREFLATHLRLSLHSQKSVIFPSWVGIDFCGFILFPTHRRLRRSSVRRFVRRFRRQRADYQNGSLTLEKWNESLRCWIAHASHGDTWRLRRRLFHDYPVPGTRAVRALALTSWSGQ